MGRIKNSFFNISTNFILLVVKTLLTFLTRTVFIYCLGKEELGLNGLFTNILSMLSIAELGIGTAISFSLYKPLSLKDENKISALMSFYKKCYQIIGIVVLVVGCTLIPFLHKFIKNINTIEDVYLIYILYLINSVSIYFVSYKETLIIADQKKYMLTRIEIVALLVLNILQIVGLLLFKNFVIYLLIQIIVLLLERVSINIYIGKLYKNIDFKSKHKIDENDKKLISTNVKAMFFHKIGDYCINGTDNLIISSFIDIATVGVYSNYLIIITLLNNFTTMVFSNLTASLGNYIVTETDEKKEEIFRIMNFVAFVMYGFSAFVLLNIFNDFITLWVGADYCLSFNTVIFIVLNFLLVGLRVPATTMKSAAGLYDVDKYTPLMQSLINLVVSIVLVRYIGILGVIIGTTISSIAIPNWQRPFFIYKYVLHTSPKQYFVSLTRYLILLFALSVLSILLFSIIAINNIVLSLLFKCIMCVLMFGITVYTVYRHTYEMTYIEELIKKYLYKLRE